MSTISTKGQITIPEELRKELSLEAGPPTIMNALLRYKNQPVDFPDARRATLAAQRKIPAASFDKDLDRFPDVTRHEPKVKK